MRGIGALWLVIGAALGFGAAMLLLPGRNAPSPAGGTGDADARAEAIALEALRNRLRNPAAAGFRDVRTWRYGPGDERAVCGLVTSPELPGGAAAFVMRVVLPESAGPFAADRPRPHTAMTVLEDGPGLARPSPEARRRFCREGDPPAPEPPPPAEAALAAPLPAPVPAVSLPLAAGAAATAGIPAARPPAPVEGGGATTTRERVAVAAPANLRAGPGGGAAVLSIVPRGRVLAVFGRAPGGWVQVGEEEPLGWIHGSLLAEAAPDGR